MKPTVWVTVLGDFGRSPRMQYHTLSLSKMGCRVFVIAMPGSQPIQEIVQSQDITLEYIPQLPRWFSKLPALVGLLLKAVLQLLFLLWIMLFKLPRPKAILMQNPPAIPSMLVCLLAARWHGAEWIVDWHNLAYSIMQLKYARHGWLIKVARHYERMLGRRAQRHFCVTSAMQQFLQRDFGLTAVVLYDRPPPMFRTRSLQEIHTFMARNQQQLQEQGIGQCLQQHLAAAIKQSTLSGEDRQSTLLTSMDSTGSVHSRAGRPAVVISSTSWTPDEDFGILLSAAQEYDAAASATTKGRYPDIIFVITGRGPDKEPYIQKIRQLKLNKVAFVSMWLEAAEYPVMLSAADLGVCLHTSSSGLDLPMKVVDMFGAGLPVCAVKFDCIDELIAAGRTGLLFSSSGELAQQLLQLFDGFEGDARARQLGQMRIAVEQEQSSWRWQDNWDKTAAPVFAAACGTDNKNM